VNTQSIVGAGPVWKVNTERTANANINLPAGDMNLCPCEVDFSNRSPSPAKSSAPPSPTRGAWPSCCCRGLSWAERRALHRQLACPAGTPPLRPALACCVRRSCTGVGLAREATRPVPSRDPTSHLAPLRTIGSDPILSLTWQIEKQIGLSFLIVIERHVEFLCRGLEIADTGKRYV
jgi:hypothetical protein